MKKQTKKMDSKNITLELNISTLEGKTMPEEQVILDALIDGIYDMKIDNTAIVDVVLITGIDGRSTDERV
jgi:hypothetical protein